MNMKFLTLILAILVLALLVPAHAQQQTKVYRIGTLSGASVSSLEPRLEGFRQGLRKLGYVDGRNIVIEYRSADGSVDRLPDLALELTRLKVDCIVTAGPRPTRAARQATTTIPIVMTTYGGDPVADGLIASLARPGGNITGLTNVSTELADKRLEFLKETISKLSRVAIFWDGRGFFHRSQRN